MAPNPAPKRGPGRPKNIVPGPERWMLEHSGEYNSARKSNAPQSTITAKANKATWLFITLWGWDSPLRRETPLRAQATPDEIEKTKISALVAESAARSDVAERDQSHSDASSVTAAQDRTVKQVRAEILKIWRNNYDRLYNPKEARAENPAHKTAEILRGLWSRPRLKPAYVQWAQSQPNTELQAAIDAHHALAVRSAVQEGLPAPSRGVSWNIVAAEQYQLASAEEKDETRKQVDNLHAQELAKWEVQFRTTPQSSEEALEFMEEIQDFTRDIAHYVANGSWGYAFMVIAGPNGATLISEAACDVPGQPKMLYTEANPTGCEQFRLGIANQARILHETRMGAPHGLISHVAETQGPSDPPASLEPTLPADTVMPIGPLPTSASGTDEPFNQAERAPAYVRTISIATRPNQAELNDRAQGSPEEGGEGSDSSCEGGSEDFTSQIKELDHQHDTRVALGLSGSEDEDEDEDDIDALDTHLLDLQHAKRAVQSQKRAPLGQIIQNDEEVVVPSCSPELYEGVRPPCSPRAGISGPFTIGGAAVSASAGVHKENAKLPEDISRPNGGSIGTNLSSIFAFDLEAHGAASTMSQAEFKKAFSAAASPVLLKKTWFGQIQTEKWLENAPKKLEGKITSISMTHVRRFILEYLRYEGSAARELPIILRTAENEHVPRPRYMAEVPQRQATTQTAMRWHSRATENKPRTGSAIDADVGVTLPKQWALLQPHARLNTGGCIYVAADASMDWSEALSPGIDGVRALIVTALQWGYNLQGQEEEEWQRLVIDIYEVLRILTSQSALTAVTADLAVCDSPSRTSQALEGEGKRIRIKSRKAREG